MIRGGFWVAFPLPVGVFRAFDGLSAGFLVVYLFLVHVKDFVVGRFPPSSTQSQSCGTRGGEKTSPRTLHTTTPGPPNTNR